MRWTIARWCFSVAVWVVVGPSSFACTPSTSVASASTTTQTACDPLTPQPITLGAVVGVGQDTAGTFYVDSANGIFVSSGMELVRQDVIGSGAGTNEFSFTFEAPTGGASDARNLLVETAGSTATAMALGPADSKAFLNESDAGVSPLTLVDPTTVSAMNIVNTPNQLEYIGDVANGDVVVGTIGENDDGAIYGGRVIFYGPPNAVAQRTITALNESLSGDGTVTFLVGGTPYVLAFGMVNGDDAGPLGTFALEGLTPQGGPSMAVTLRSLTSAAVPPDLSFTCVP